MLRLIFCDLRDHATVWIGALVQAIACGCLTGYAASMQATAASCTGAAQRSLGSGSGMMLALSLISGATVLVSAANLTVLCQRRSYALWQIANVAPRAVTAIVLIQLAVVAALGAAIGTMIAAATFGALFPIVFSSKSYVDAVVPRVDLARIPAMWIAVVATFLIGGLRAARAAGATPPMSALREPETTHVRMTRSRVATFVMLAALSCWAASTISGASPTAGMTTALLLPGLLVATLVPAAPMILPALLDSWTRLVPGSWGSAWYLACRSAICSLGMSMSVETPIMVGSGLVAGLFSVIRVLAAHARALGATDTSGFRLDVSTTLLLLGGPVVLCALSAAVSVIMSSRSRTRDVALMTVAGADARTIVATSALEALIHALSASAVGAASVLATCAVVDGAYGLPFSVGIDFMPGLVVSSVGFALVLAATLAPAIANLRRPPARALSSGQ